MKTKPSKTFIVAVIALIIIMGLVWHRWNERAHAPLMAVNPAQDGAAAYILSHGQINSAAPAPPRPPGSNHVLVGLGFRENANQMTDAEKAEMTNLFVTRLKPAVEKWFSVYSNRVPFNLPDLTMDKFVERLGRDSNVYHSYTFVMGDITFGIAEQNGDTAVQYLASKRNLATMESLPTAGASPDMSMPVTPQQVLAMAEADSGTEFPPNLVQLVPSAESGSLAGGAIADVGSAVKNAMGMSLSKSSTGFNYVFAKDGTLAYYLRN